LWRLEAYLSLLRVRDLWLLDLCRDLFVDGDLLRDVEDDLEDESDDEEEEGDLSRLLDCRPDTVRLGDLERRLWPCIITIAIIFIFMVSVFDLLLLIVMTIVTVIIVIDITVMM